MANDNGCVGDRDAYYEAVCDAVEALGVVLAGRLVDDHTRGELLAAQGSLERHLEAESSRISFEVAFDRFVNGV